MSAAEGVPLTRELLEALEADAAARCGGSSVEARRRKALNLMEACIAAGAAAPPTNAPEISTSLVDAAAPDAALVQKCGACGHDRVAHRGRTGQCIGIVAHDRLPCYCREFVAESSDAPAPAPAPGDASGETDADFESALDAYRDDLMSNTRVGARGGLRALEPDRTELRRLYRAATGEVVASGVVADYNWERGRLIVNLDDTPESDGKRPNRGTRVVLRRDKEGV